MWIRPYVQVGKQQCSEKQPKCTQPSATPALHAVLWFFKPFNILKLSKEDLSFNDLNHAAMLNLEVTPLERHLTPYYQQAEENNVSSSISAEWKEPVSPIYQRTQISHQSGCKKLLQIPKTVSYKPACKKFMSFIKCHG